MSSGDGTQAMTSAGPDAASGSGRSEWSRYWAVGLGVLIAAVYAGGCLSFWMAHGEGGSRMMLFLPHASLQVLGALGPMVLTFVAVVSTLFGRFRAGLSFLLLAVWLGGCLIAYMRLNDSEVCERSWPRIAERARPVVAAILAYEKRNGSQHRRWGASSFPDGPLRPASCKRVGAHGVDG